LTSEKTTTFPYITLRDLSCVTEMGRVYCAVRSESLYKTDTFFLKD